MLKRLVKMTFQPDKVNDFIAVFEESKHKIRAMPGCHHLELWRSGSVFFTYSIWESEQALNHYRYSELFKSTWARTKPLFAEKAEAWSLQIESETA
ncbi:MAG TPA: antibiotic biosynthesis monooxygenase [Saprospiraceae bacterium]|nr:antibiotic biosynthesis monooxygenase [Saprospiraceae bacterium]HMP25377.1 antibiotic biosynthesis monooxygenase [Saprospiraceae bacterium]